MRSIVMVLSLLIVPAAQAADCGYFDITGNAELSFDELAQPQSLTIVSFAEVTSCTLERSNDDRMPLRCDDGSARSLVLQNSFHSPTVFVVDRVAYTWSCAIAAETTLKPGFSLNLAAEKSEAQR